MRVGVNRTAQVHLLRRPRCHLNQSNNDPVTQKDDPLTGTWLVYYHQE